MRAQRVALEKTVIAVAFFQRRCARCAGGRRRSTRGTGGGPCLPGRRRGHPGATPVRSHRLLEPPPRPRRRPVDPRSGPKSRSRTNVVSLPGYHPWSTARSEHPSTQAAPLAGSSALSTPSESASPPLARPTNARRLGLTLAVGWRTRANRRPVDVRVRARGPPAAPKKHKSGSVQPVVRRLVSVRGRQVHGVAVPLGKLSNGRKLCLGTSQRDSLQLRDQPDLRILKPFD
jgi:hypothetical protein